MLMAQYSKYIHLYVCIFCSSDNTSVIISVMNFVGYQYRRQTPKMNLIEMSGGEAERAEMDGDVD